MKLFEKIINKDINFKFEIDERMCDESENVYFSSYLNIQQKRDFFEEVIEIIKNNIEFNNPLIKSYNFSIDNNNIFLSIKLENNKNNIINSIISLDEKYLGNIDGTHYYNENIDINKWDINNIKIYINVQQIL